MCPASQLITVKCYGLKKQELFGQKVPGWPLKKGLILVVQNSSEQYQMW